jgi:hypothetical protein
MTDYEAILDVLKRRNIRFKEDWNREALLHDTRIYRWISIFSEKEEIRFRFSYEDKLEDISSLTNE